MTKYFGTDGIRGKVGEAITPELALRIGYAAGRAFKESWTKTSTPKVIIGKDTRISGYLLESALESGFSAAGVDVTLLGPMPTPAVAYLTRTFHACAGIVVSASHNKFYDNGIKFFSSRGRKLDDELEAKIEKYLGDPIVLVEPTKLGKAYRVDDAKGRYIEHCKSTVPARLELTGLHIVLDCANGATYQVAPSVFKELGADVTIIHNNPDGLNINENCGSTEPESLVKKVIETSADIGIAFDGDGDRVTIVDNEGNIIDGDAIIYLILLSQINKGVSSAGVVGTVMSNMGTEKAIKDLGISFKRSGVGDRYVMEMLNDYDWVLGGEASGHIICLDKSTTGDGIVAALQVLELLVNTEKTIPSLLSNYELYPLRLENVIVSDKSAIMENPMLLSEIDETNKILGKSGRLLIRASGTEPKVRVMVEAEEQVLVDKYTQKFVDIVKSI